MAHDVFISYAAEDKITADAVCATLERDGIRCWIAPRDCLPGLDWPPQIIEAIESTRVVVLVFSDNANNSWPVKNEVECAMRKEVPIIPLRIQNVPPSKTLEFFISTPHWLDAMSPPMETHLQRLAKNVHALLDRTELDPAKKKQRQRDLPGPQPVRRLPVVAMACAAVAVIAILFALWAIFGRGGATNLNAIVPPQREAAQGDTLPSAPTPTPAAAGEPTQSPAPQSPTSPAPAPSTPAAPATSQSLRQRVEAMIREGRFNDAISEADNARTTNPAAAQEATLLRAIARIHWLDHRAALDDLFPLLRRADVTPEVRIWYAIAAIGRDQLLQAQGQIQYVIVRSPGDGLALTARSMLYAAQWKQADSIRDGIAAKGALRDNYLASMALGNAYNLAGNVKAAAEEFTAAHNLSPKAPGPLAGRASARAVLGELSTARDDAQRAVELAAPKAFLPYLALFQVYMAQEDYPRALTAAEDAVKSDPDFWPTLVARASARIMSDRAQDALADANKAVQETPRADTFAIRAWAHAKVGNITSSTADGDRAIRLDRTSPAAYNGRGLARLFANNPAGALEDFEQLHRLLPTSPYARLMYATAQVQAYAATSPGRLVQAEQDLKNLISEGTYIRQAYRQLAPIYLATNRPVDANDALQRSR